MSQFNGRICAEYEYLPLINPDFIYLDGPNPFSVSGNINNFSTAHKELMPMASDILKIEPFLNFLFLYSDIFLRHHNINISYEAYLGDVYLSLSSPLPHVFFFFSQF